MGADGSNAALLFPAQRKNCSLILRMAGLLRAKRFGKAPGARFENAFTYPVVGGGEIREQDDSRLPALSVRRP